MFSTICIQGTWLRNDQDTSRFEIPGYSLIHKGKSCSEHGRMIIYLKEELTHNYWKLYNQFNLSECLFVDVFKIKAFKFYYKYSQKHHPFILIQYSPKLLIDKIMELDNNQFKFFIDIQLEPI